LKEKDHCKSLVGLLVRGLSPSHAVAADWHNLSKKFWDNITNGTMADGILRCDRFL
jgi:hypothetical protein